MRAGCARAGSRPSAARPPPHLTAPGDRRPQIQPQSRIPGVFADHAKADRPEEVRRPDTPGRPSASRRTPRPHGIPASTRPWRPPGRGSCPARAPGSAAGSVRSRVRRHPGCRRGRERLDPGQVRRRGVHREPGRLVVDVQDDAGAAQSSSSCDSQASFSRPVSPERTACLAATGSSSQNTQSRHGTGSSSRLASVSGSSRRAISGRGL